MPSLQQAITGPSPEGRTFGVHPVRKGNILIQAVCCVVEAAIGFRRPFRLQ